MMFMTLFEVFIGLRITNDIGGGLNPMSAFELLKCHVCRCNRNY